MAAKWRIGDGTNGGIPPKWRDGGSEDICFLRLWPWKRRFPRLRRRNSRFSLGALLEDCNRLACGRGRLALRRAIGVDHSAAEWGQCRAAARLAARLRVDDRRAERVAEFAHKAPSAGVAHAQREPRAADRAVLVDQLKQAHFARPDGAVAFEVDAERDARHGFECGPHPANLQSGGSAPSRYL